MTIQQAIERANDMKAGNAAPDELKIKWLDEIDKTIYDDVIMHFTHDTTPTQPEYSEDDTTVTLLAEAPYDELYVYWLMAKIDLFAQELNKYNNSLSLFQEVYQRYKNKYRADHTPVDQPEIRVGRFW